MPAINDFYAWLSWSVVLAVGFVLLLSDRRNRNIWVSPLRWFGLGYVTFYLLPSFNVLFFNRMPFVIYQQEKFVTMSLAVAAGGLSFLLGWRLKRKTLLGAAGADEALTVALQRLGVQVLLLSLVALTSVLVVVYYFEGLEPLLTSTVSVFDQIGGAFYNIYSLLFAAFVPLLALLLLAWLHLHGPQKLLLTLVLAAILLVYVLLAVKLGARYRLLFVAVSTFAIYLAVIRARRIGWRLALLLAGFGLFAFVLGGIRYQLTLAPADLAARVVEVLQPESDSLYTGTVLRGDLDAFENGMELISLVPVYRPPMWGSTLLSVLYNPIPRFLWPGKPSPSASQYLADFGLGPARVGHLNFAVSLIAELYVNFWWAGVIGGMLILGLASAWLWNWFLTNLSQPHAWFHIGLFGAYLFIVSRGSFHAMTVYYLMVVVNEVWTRKVAAFLTTDAHVRSRRQARYAPLRRRAGRITSEGGH